MKARKFWSFKHNEPILGIELGDINNDGNEEVVVHTKAGRLLILSLKGELLSKDVISKDSPIWHLQLCDIDKDGTKELILGGFDGYLRTFKCNKTHVLNSFWKHKLGSSISGILIDDLNNNNCKEIIVFSLDKTIRVLNYLDGSLLWGQIFEKGVGDAIIYKDLRSPRKKELYACGNDGTIRIFEAPTGKLIWYKKYSDKMRCITYLNSTQGKLIMCGGDDKKLHLLKKDTQEEIKTIEFNDYVWKCLSYSFPNKTHKVIISSYSFAYFDNSISLENLKITSKLICLNESLEVVWELRGFNIESLKAFELDNRIYFLAGSTKGEVLIIEEKTGKIIYKTNHYSCTNMVHFLMEKDLIFSCHDNGNIIAYKLEV